MNKILITTEDATSSQYISHLFCQFFKTTNMPIQSKISTGTPASNSNPGPSPLELAVTYYYANRETPVTRLYPAKDGVSRKIVQRGISLRRVAAMHQIPFSALQRAVATGGEI